MVPSEPLIPRRRRPFALTFFGLIAIAGLAAMPVLAGRAGEVEMPDLVRFVGHFHPVLLHLPIGVFILILCQELGAIFGKRRHPELQASLFPMFFGAASAILAVITGFLLFHGHGGDYGGNALAERHLWGGLVFAIAAVFTFIVKAWTLALAANPAWYRLLLFGSVGIMGFASHDGASLTHGSDYLTKYAPEPLRRMMGLDAGKPTPAAPAASQVVYADLIAPIFERRCVSCHKEGKAKGKLRMDTFEMLVKGGKEGPAIEPGKSAESNIIVRIELPEDDDEHMPPEGKPDIEAHELAVLKWWIDNGADPAKTLADYEVPAEIGAAISKLGGAKPDETTGTAAHPAPAPAAAGAGVDEALQSVVTELARQFPGAVSFESQESPLVTFSAVSLRGKLDDAGFAKLAPVIPHLASVDLSATLVTDKAVASLLSAKNLRLVRLAETSVTDAAIDTLLQIPTLESVNFYGTKVTDAGVLKLTGLPKLKHLYLWRTAVTPDALKTLREKLPACEIVTGA